jgi:coenzyme F420-0:L-glutamate ligase/coenzyme F420-1:gamma-L-glutamate ligase
VIQIIGVAGMPEIQAGDDLVGLALEALLRDQRDHRPHTPGQDDVGTPVDHVGETGRLIRDGDVVVFTSKIVSKAEGRTVQLESVTPSALAASWAAEHGKDARHVEVVLREASRIVRMDRGVLIAETRHGFICANAGVDASNAAANGQLLLLPEDPDASARRLRAAFTTRAGVDVAVVISDTFGRPWRLGQTNVAIGASGIHAIRSYIGNHDPTGRVLHATAIAVVDELAAAAELAMGKLDRVPVALLRGYNYPRVDAGDPDLGAARLVRQATLDLFR